MKYFSNLLFVIILLPASCKNKPKADTDSVSSPIETSENWKSLFNGENLNGWLVKINGYDLNDNYNKTFRVENGVLKVSYDTYDSFKNEFGHIFYETPFTNYKFRLQYRFEGNQVKGGKSWATKNSGIMLHSQSPESMLKKQGFPLSLEFQLLGGINENESRPTGNLCTPATHVEINGELITEHYITAEVKVNNDSITHFINGKAVISYSNPIIGGQFLNSTSDKIQAKEGQSLAGGYISLQSESHPTGFKNIEILELLIV